MAVSLGGRRREPRSARNAERYTENVVLIAFAANFPVVAFDRPLFLVAAPVLAAFFWLMASGRWSSAAWAARQRKVALGLRFVIATSLVLALAGPRFLRPTTAVCTLFVVDVSDSIGKDERARTVQIVQEATRAMKRGDRVGVVTVGGEARLAFAPAERGAVSFSTVAPDGKRTNLAHGVALALASFPVGSVRRVVLVTDGNETVGAIEDAAQGARGEDVPIDVIALGKRPLREVVINRVLAPPSAKRGEPFTVQVVATTWGDKPAPGTLTLYRNDVPVGSQAVTLKPGKSAVNINAKTDAPGFYEYEARFTAAKGADTVAQNNRAVGFVKVEGRPRVLLVRSDAPNAIPETFLPRALRAQSIDADLIAPRAFPVSASDLLRYDGVVISDVPADSFTLAQMKAVRAGVRDVGLGLTMLGGDNGFGAGGYFGTPVEDALPVSMDVRKLRRFPGVALALAIDYSGSMNMASQNGSTNQSKLELAHEAADRAVDTLSVQDQVGVIAVDTKATVVYPLQFVTNKKAAHEAIGAIEGGGGTDMSAGVRSAFAMLETAKARIKHVILVTDGETAPFDYVEAIKEYRAKKITFTLVVLDEGQSEGGIGPLKRIAAKTGGRFYSVRDASEIPKIYTREAEIISRPPLVEEPFLARVADSGNPLLTGVRLETAPPLLGYDAVTARPTADVALLTHHNDVLLATWQYGLGKSVAWTSDAKAHWGAQWVGWGGYAPFWAQAIRWSLKRTEPGGYQSAITIDGTGKGKIVVDAVDAKTGAFVNFLNAKARVIGPDGAPQSAPLTQTGAGRYEGAFDASLTGSYVAIVSQKAPDGKTKTATVGASVPYSPEFAALGPNLALLARVADATGGRVLTGGADVFNAPRAPIPFPIPLAPYLIGFALFLFPIDVAARRLAIFGEPGEARELVRDTQDSVALAAARARAQAKADREARERAAALASRGSETLAARKARLQAEDDGVSESDSSPPLAGTGSRLGDAKRRWMDDD